MASYWLLKFCHFSSYGGNTIETDASSPKDSAEVAWCSCHRSKGFAKPCCSGLLIELFQLVEFYCSYIGLFQLIRSYSILLT